MVMLESKGRFHALLQFVGREVGQFDSLEDGRRCHIFGKGAEFWQRLRVVRVSVHQTARMDEGPGALQ